VDQDTQAKVERVAAVDTAARVANLVDLVLVARVAAVDILLPPLTTVVLAMMVAMEVILAMVVTTMDMSPTMMVAMLEAMDQVPTLDIAASLDAPVEAANQASLVDQDTLAKVARAVAVDHQAREARAVAVVDQEHPLEVMMLDTMTMTMADTMEEMIPTLTITMLPVIMITPPQAPVERVDALVQASLASRVDLVAQARVANLVEVGQALARVANQVDHLDLDLAPQEKIMDTLSRFTIPQVIPMMPVIRMMAGGQI